MSWMFAQKMVQYIVTATSIVIAFLLLLKKGKLLRG